MFEKESSLFYCSYSKTIRQSPQNYLVAELGLNGWVCSPDLAADKKLCTKVFLSIFEYENKYEKNGDALVERVLLKILK